MVIKPTKVHKHVFSPLADQKVMVTQGRKEAIDMLKRRKCECGKIETYDLTRKIM